MVRRKQIQNKNTKGNGCDNKIQHVFGNTKNPISDKPTRNTTTSIKQASRIFQPFTKTTTRRQTLNKPKTKKILYEIIVIKQFWAIKKVELLSFILSADLIYKKKESSFFIFIPLQNKFTIPTKQEPKSFRLNKIFRRKEKPPKKTENIQVRYSFFKNYNR